MDDLDCEYVESGINDKRSRRIAWSDSEITADRYDPLATQWMRDWQVGEQALPPLSLGRPILRLPDGRGPLKSSV